MQRASSPALGSEDEEDDGEDERSDEENATSAPVTAERKKRPSQTKGKKPSRPRAEGAY